MTALIGNETQSASQHIFCLFIGLVHNYGTTEISYSHTTMIYLKTMFYETTEYFNGKQLLPHKGVLYLTEEYDKTNDFNDTTYTKLYFSRLPTEIKRSLKL